MSFYQVTSTILLNQNFSTSLSFWFIEIKYSSLCIFEWNYINTTTLYFLLLTGFCEPVNHFSIAFYFYIFITVVLFLQLNLTCKSFNLICILGEMDRSCAYATLQTMGIDLLPLREKIHNFHKNTWIFKNSVSFFFLDICPHDIN